MSRLVSWMEALAASFGGGGLFVVAFLDSSFLSLPEINDVLVVLMVTRNKALMPYYAAMATLGSITGCLVLYTVGRKGGEAILRKRFTGPRVEKALALFQRFGVLAIIVPALLPPPAPFKVFVLLSGVARVPIVTFSGAGRGRARGALLRRRRPGGALRGPDGRVLAREWVAGVDGAGDVRARRWQRLYRSESAPPRAVDPRYGSGRVTHFYTITGMSHSMLKS